MLPEELRELSGSLLFSLVLLYLARKAASAQPGRASRQARRPKLWGNRMRVSAPANPDDRRSPESG